MEWGRRMFLGGAGALVGGSVGGLALGQGRPPVTREQWDAQVRGEMAASNFNCTVAPSADEGPFYDPASPRRRDITEGRKGEALKLRITVGGTAFFSGCFPLKGAIVDIWQANAHGQYSNVGENIQQEATPGQTFMRGHQLTNDMGVVEFDTVVPGWEAIAIATPMGATARTTHIHVKIFHEWMMFTTQLYFPDSLIDSLYAEVEPYKSLTTLPVPGTQRRLTRIGNGNDSLFRRMNAAPMEITRAEGKLLANVSIGTFGTTNRGIGAKYGPG